jgi:DNA-binding NarL/FixJ family response regulator
MSTALKVVLADDHRILREGIRALLEASPSQEGPIKVIGEAGDGVEALALCRKLSPDVLVLDLGLPKLSGLEVADELQRSGSDIRVVVLTMHVTAEHVRRARECGGKAYVVKGSGVGELAKAIRVVAKGGEGPFPEMKSDPLATLTAREREVLVHIAKGGSNREIAAALDISVHTVNTHRVHLMEKLGAHDVVALTRLAVEAGLA